MGFLDKATRSLAKAVDQYGDTIDREGTRLGRIPGQRTGARRSESIGDGARQPRRSPDRRDGRGDDARAR